MSVPAGALGLLLAALSLGAALPLYAQDAETHVQALTPLPRGHLFQPLIADPKTPRFDTSVLRATSGVRNTTVWAVAFGENFGLARWGTGRRAVQLNLSGAVFAQFDLGTPSWDLINADYVIGIPLAVRVGAVSAQVRLYHQSSHLGDEFLLSAHPQRVNLSFESLEWLASYDRAGWRLYGGWEYLLHREPAELRPRTVQIGIERRHVNPLLRIGDVAVGRLVAALDGQWSEQHGWGPAWSAKAGLEFGSAVAGGEPTRRWSLLVQYYNGPSPYGQFYTQDVAYVGAGLQFTF